MAEGAQHEFASIRATSRRLGCSRELLREAIGRGELPAYRFGARTVRLNWGEVVAFARRHQIRSNATAEQIAQDLLEREE